MNMKKSTLAVAGTLLTLTLAACGGSEPLDASKVVVGKLTPAEAKERAANLKKLDKRAKKFRQTYQQQMQPK